MKFKALIGAAALTAALPMAANAAIIESGIDPADGPFDMPGSYFSNVEFNHGESGTLTWTFKNTSNTEKVLTIAVATVSQFAPPFPMPHAFFTGGTTTSLGLDTKFTSEGFADTFTLSTVIAAGGMADLKFVYGVVVEQGGNNVAFDFNIAGVAAPVPLPASVLMLLAALGGLGALSRRSKSAIA